MDQIYSFLISGGKAVQINPRTDMPGLLELHSSGVDQANSEMSNDGVLLLFRGSLTAEECAQSLSNNGRTSFLLSANKYESGKALWDGNESSFTVYCLQSGTVGYVRICSKPSRT